MNGDLRQVVLEMVYCIQYAGIGTVRAESN